MNRTPTTFTRRVKVLTDPQPEAVSLVKAGANMTPFRVVKDNTLQPVAKSEAQTSALSANGVALPTLLLSITVRAVKSDTTRQAALLPEVAAAAEQFRLELSISEVLDGIVRALAPVPADKLPVAALEELQRLQLVNVIRVGAMGVRQVKASPAVRKSSEQTMVDRTTDHFSSLQPVAKSDSGMLHQSLVPGLLGARCGDA